MTEVENPSRIRFIAKGTPEFTAAYAGYGKEAFAHDFVRPIKVGSDPDRDLREFIVSARNHGLKFRFWSATKFDTRHGIHVSFKTKEDADAFSSFLFERQPQPVMA